MKQPFTYYGGKQRLLPELLKLIPPHTQYVECFTGGGTMFWAKPPSHNEVINDMNGAVTNFYWQVKTNFAALEKLISATLHSEIHYKRSKEIVNDENADPLERAWALWCQCSMTFSSIIGGGFAFGTNGCGYTTQNRRERFTDKYSQRLEAVEIFNRDALDMIKLKDTPETFFYLDPPYVSSEQGHYDGYTEAHFINLLNALQNIKGKFLLSSYPEKALMQFREQCNTESIGDRFWRSKDIRQIVSVDGNRKEQKFKIECLTWNYDAPSQQVDMFSGENKDEAGGYELVSPSEMAALEEKENEEIEAQTEIDQNGDEQDNQKNESEGDREEETLTESELETLNDIAATVDKSLPQTKEHTQPFTSNAGA